MKPRYAVNIQWSDEDGCFVARAPDLPGCLGHGDTYEEAAACIREAMEGMLEVKQAHGDPIPEPLPTTKDDGAQSTIQSAPPYALPEFFVRAYETHIRHYWTHSAFPEGVDIIAPEFDMWLTDEGFSFSPGHSKPLSLEKTVEICIEQYRAVCACFEAFRRSIGLRLGEIEP